MTLISFERRSFYDKFVLKLLIEREYVAFWNLFKSKIVTGFLQLDFFKIVDAS
jgi:hypothetical protein